MFLFALLMFSISRGEFGFTNEIRILNIISGIMIIGVIILLPILYINRKHYFIYWKNSY